MKPHIYHNGEEWRCESPMVPGGGETVTEAYECWARIREIVRQEQIAYCEWVEKNCQRPYKSVGY